jgi:hypothetical protein
MCCVVITSRTVHALSTSIKLDTLSPSIPCCPVLLPRVVTSLNTPGGGSTVGTTGGTTASVHGDPIMTGFDGRVFEFMGEPGKFYNIISERHHQVRDPPILKAGRLPGAVSPEKWPCMLSAPLQ